MPEKIIVTPDGYQPIHIQGTSTTTAEIQGISDVEYFLEGFKQEAYAAQLKSLHEARDEATGFLNSRERRRLTRLIEDFPNDFHETVERRVSVRRRELSLKYSKYKVIKFGYVKPFDSLSLVSNGIISFPGEIEKDDEGFYNHDYDLLWDKACFWASSRGFSYVGVSDPVESFREGVTRRTDGYPYTRTIVNFYIENRGRNK